MKKRNSQWKSEEASSLAVAQSLVNLWRQRAIVLGIALILNIASIVPFLQDHFLHAYADKFGKYLIYLSMCLLPVFAFCAWQTCSFWLYLRDLKKAYMSDSTHS